MVRAASQPDNTRAYSQPGQQALDWTREFSAPNPWRRTKAALIYRRTGNLRAVQLLLGHTKIESTVRYLGIEVDDALAIAEQVDV
jgi:integrase